MLNHITIMGRLVRDPELRRTGNGIAVASFTLAVDRDYSGKDSNDKETDFIDCVAWRATGEFVSKYFTKGRMMVVSGRLQIRTWDDKEGNKRRSAEVVCDNCYFGDNSKKPEEQNAGNYSGNPNGYGAPNNYGAPNGGYPQNNGGGNYGGYPQNGGGNNYGGYPQNGGNNYGGYPQNGGGNNYGGSPQNGVPAADQNHSYQEDFQSYSAYGDPTKFD